MKKKLAIIGAIEGTECRTLEKDYLFMVNTLLKTNCNDDYDIHLLQPTEYDILPETKKELESLGVYYHKKISEYNQPGRDFNYTNKPIACEYFFNNISDNYEFFLWLDGDILVRSKLILPDIGSNDVMYIYNNEFYSKEYGEYITFSSENYLHDHECYLDLCNNLGFKNTDYRATNSWVVYSKSKNNLWKEWNKETKKYIQRVKKIGPQNFLFYKNDINFENRIEEWTLDVVIKNNNYNHILPEGFHTFNSKDINCKEFNEDYIKSNHTIHFDNVSCLYNNKILSKYFNTPFIKTTFMRIYGIDSYKRIFT